MPAASDDKRGHDGGGEADAPVVWPLGPGSPRPWPGGPLRTETDVPTPNRRDGPLGEPCMAGLKIRRIVCASPDANKYLNALRDQAEHQAESVTAQGKKLTTAVFGEPIAGRQFPQFRLLRYCR